MPFDHRLILGNYTIICQDRFLRTPTDRDVIERVVQV